MALGTDKYIELQGELIPMVNTFKHMGSNVEKLVKCGQK